MKGINVFLVMSVIACVVCSLAGFLNEGGLFIGIIFAALGALQIGAYFVVSRKHNPAKEFMEA